MNSTSLRYVFPVAHTPWKENCSTDERKGRDDLVSIKHPSSLGVFKKLNRGRKGKGMTNYVFYYTEVYGNHFGQSKFYVWGRS